MGIYDVEFALSFNGQSGRAIVSADSVARAKEIIKERLENVGFKAHKNDVYDILYIDLDPSKEGVILIGVT